MNLPPKTLPALARQRMQVRGADPGPGESLPVLEAFQRYLDRERAQAQRRLMGLVAFFAAFLIVLAAGVFMAAFLFLSPWQEDIADMQKRMSEWQSAVAGMENGETALADMRQETEQLSRALARETDRVAGMRTQADEQATRHQSDLRRMGEVLKRLTENHRALNNELVAVKAERPDLDAAIRSALAERDRGQTPVPEAKPVAAAQAPPGIAMTTRLPIPSVSLPDPPILAPMERLEQPVAQAAPPRTVADEERIVELTVRPRGGRETIRWRVSIPPNFAAADKRDDRAVRFQ